MTTSGAFWRTALAGRMNYIGLHNQIFEDELRRIGVVGMDTADFGRSQIHLVWFFSLHKVPDRLLVQQVQLPAGSGDDVGLSQRFETSDNGAAGHAAVAGHIDFLSSGCRHFMSTLKAFLKSSHVT